jgi:hypothetical protein
MPAAPMRWLCISSCAAASSAACATLNWSADSSSRSTPALQQQRSQARAMHQALLRQGWLHCCSAHGGRSQDAPPPPPLPPPGSSRSARRSPPLHPLALLALLLRPLLQQHPHLALQQLHERAAAARRNRLVRRGRRDVVVALCVVCGACLALACVQAVGWEEQAVRGQSWHPPQLPWQVEQEAAVQGPAQRPPYLLRTSRA